MITSNVVKQHRAPADPRSMNVDPALLKRGVVPMLCAKTGEPATHLRHHVLPVWRRVSYWWLLLGLAAWVIPSLVRTRCHVVALPISAGVRLNYGVLRLARLAAFGVFLSTVPRGSLPLTGGTALGWLVVHRETRAAWVRVKGYGRVLVKVTGGHVDFHEALREAPARNQLAVGRITAGLAAAGWYPDPGGVHVLRFWDGAQWTTQVAGAA